jgi:hypothetical protein
MAAEERTFGDTLILKGTLGATVLPDGVVWAGAVAKMNIRLKDTNVLIIDHGVCTLDTVTLDYEYKSTTPPPIGLVVGSYSYEVEVTFSPGGEIISFPNGHTKMPLKIVAQVG